MANDAAEWLEAMPYPALLIGADFTVAAANALAAPFARHLLEDALLQNAVTRVLAEGRNTTFTQLRLPNMPACDGSVTLAPGQLALVILELPRESQLGVAQTFTELSSTMAAMLAHEIRNPLLSIRGAAQLLSGSSSAEDAPLCELIMKEVARIDQLIATLDPLSVTPPRAVEPLNIHEALEHARMAAAAAFGPQIQYQQQYDPSLPPIAAHRDALVQALANLLKNAAEAVEELPEPRIILTSRYTLGETRRNAAGVPLPIAISITDNGAGVSEAMEEQLFAPFTTSKPSGKGLGLAIVARIVQEHGGLIAHDRPKEGGARFTLYLPAAG